MDFLEIDKLSAFYGKAKALHEVSLSVKQGEIIAIVGANGAGKSTFLDSIMGLTKTEGDIRLEGKSLIGNSTPKIVQSGVGYAPERFNLFPYMSVYDNLLVGAFTARDDIDNNLEVVENLFPRLKERRNQETHTQSGGERQMVSLGRALMSSPRLLLVDEPTIGLAPKICLEIASVLRRLREEFNTTIVVGEDTYKEAKELHKRMYKLGSVTVKGKSNKVKIYSIK